VTIEVQITAFLAPPLACLPFVGAVSFVFDQEFDICPEASSTD
jgi:hypothetical protein